MAIAPAIHSKQIFFVSSPPKSRRLWFGVSATLLALLVVFIARNGVRSLHRVPQWTTEALRLKFYPTEDASAGAYYDRTAHGLLPLATIMREMRQSWPAEKTAVIHYSGLEVGTALLHRPDIVAGELVDGKFVPYKSPPWHINETMIAEVRGSPSLFDNERVYVFRRK